MVYWSMETLQHHLSVDVTDPFCQRRCYWMNQGRSLRHSYLRWLPFVLYWWVPCGGCCEGLEMPVIKKTIAGHPISLSWSNSKTLSNLATGDGWRSPGFDPRPTINTRMVLILPAGWAQRWLSAQRRAVGAFGKKASGGSAISGGWSKGCPF